MVNMPEAQNGGNDLEALNQELAQLDASAVAELIAKEIERETMRQAAQDIRRRVDRSIERQGTTPEKFDGSKDDTETAKGKAAAVQKVVRQIMLGARQDKIAAPKNKPPEVKDFAVDAIKKISEAVNPETVSESAAPYLFDILSKLIKGEIESVDDLSAAFSASANLEQAGNITFQRLQDGLINIAREEGYTEEDAQEKFSKIEAPEEEELRGKVDTIEQKKQYIERSLNISGIFLPTEKEVDVAWALLDPEKFTEFLHKQRNEIIADAERTGKTLTEENLQRELSEKIELRVGLFFNGLFRDLAKSQPDTYFNEIAQKDIYQGFSVAFTRLESMLGALDYSLRNSSNPIIQALCDKQKNGFWKLGQERVDEERTYEGKDTEKKKIDISYISEKIKPFPVREKVSLPDFVEYLKIIISHERDVREYTHNAIAIFYNPAGEKGFYQQLAAYAEKMRTADIDQLLALPDNDIFMTAFNLYTKFLEEDFAKYDWRHQPSTFDVFLANRTKIEKKVLEQLQMVYPDFHDRDKWRFERAISLAVGSSLGIFMSEVEMAAYADPFINPDGSPNFGSFYRNDTAAIGPLNPFPHEFWRWQQEGTLMSDLLFLPVKGKLPRIHDHTIVLEELRKHKEAYKNRDMSFLNDGRTRLIDIMNIGRLGGPITRSGWRSLFSYDNWLIYKEGIGGVYTDRLNYLESWKSLENIGFEALFNFVGGPKSSKFTKEFLEGKLSELTDIQMRRDFFRHIYTKYIKSDGSDADFDNYYDKLNTAISHKKTLEGKSVKSGSDVARFEILKALSGVLRARIPTKFLRLERGRLVKGGKSNRLWDKVQGNDSNEVFVKKIDDILIAEQLLRADTSRKMKEWLNDPLNKGKRLNECEIHDYELTSERLEELLSSKGIGATRIQEAKITLENIRKMLNSDYMLGFAHKLDERGSESARTDLPFSIAPEEFDMRFVSFRTAGGRVLPRAIGEISQGEARIYGHLKEYSKLLKKVLTDPKHDFGPIVDVIGDMQEFLEMIHGKEYSYEVAHHMALITVAYFKKDTMARNIFTKAFRIGKFNSLGAHITTGTFRNPWEWEAADAYNFIAELARRHILPKDKVDYSNPEIKYGINLSNSPVGKIFSKIGLPDKFFRRIGKNTATWDYYGSQISESAGATKRHLFYEHINKYVPIILLLMLYSYITSAIKENQRKQ